jgi:hypothetical protein
MPRASTIPAGSPPSVQTISNRSLAILPEISPAGDQVQHAAQLRRETGLSAISRPFLVQPAEQLVDHPVRRLLAVAALRHGLEEGGGIQFGRQHARVIVGQAEVGHEPRLLGVGQFRHGGAMSSTQACSISSGSRSGQGK